MCPCTISPHQPRPESEMNRGITTWTLAIPPLLLRRPSSRDQLRWEDRQTHQARRHKLNADKHLHHQSPDAPISRQSDRPSWAVSPPDRAPKPAGQRGGCAMRHKSLSTWSCFNLVAQSGRRPRWMRPRPYFCERRLGTLVIGHCVEKIRASHIVLSPPRLGRSYRVGPGSGGREGCRWITKHQVQK